MENSIDYKNITGIFPISQQLLGLYEVSQDLYEIAAIISKAVINVFKQLFGCNSGPKASKDNQWVPLEQVAITDAKRANSIDSPVPFFTEEEKRNTGSMPEPIFDRCFANNVLHGNTNKPLFTDEERNRRDIPDDEHHFIPVDIAEEMKDTVIAYEPTFSLNDSSLEDSRLKTSSSSWEKLKEPVTKIGIGILYFLPVVGTFYSIKQLLPSCNNESLAKKL